MLGENANRWLNKYYPVPAHEMRERSMLECIEHSILKWEGVSCAHEYDLVIGGASQFGVYEIDWQFIADAVVMLDGKHCALCVKVSDLSGPPECERCPLYACLGRPCDAPAESDHDIEDSLFYRSMKNPRLMVIALKRARAMVAGESA